jgi:hypothetical protein
LDCRGLDPAGLGKARRQQSTRRLPVCEHTPPRRNSVDSSRHRGWNAAKRVLDVASFEAVVFGYILSPREAWRGAVEDEAPGVEHQEDRRLRSNLRWSTVGGSKEERDQHHEGGQGKRPDLPDRSVA